MTYPSVLLSEVAGFNPAAPKRLIGSPTEVAFVPMASVSETGTMAVRDHRPGTELNAGFSYFQNGDVVVAKITPCYENNKTCAVDIDREHGFGSTEFHVIRPVSSCLDSRYLTFFLRQDRVREAGIRRMTGSAGQRRVPRAFLEALEIPLPPLDEQRRIAAILDQADELRRKRRRVTKLLIDLRRNLFTQMFGSHRPNGWQWEVGTFRSSGRVQVGRQRAPQFQTGKFTRPYLRVANVHEDRLALDDVLSMDFNEDDFRDYSLAYGDVLLNEVNSTELVGRPAIWRNEIQNCCFQNSIIRFQPDPLRIDFEFAFAVCLHYFRTGVFASSSSKTSSVAHLGSSRLAALPFPLPPLELQRKFSASIIELRKQEALCERSADFLDTLFASLQHRAFGGEL